MANNWCLLPEQVEKFKKGLRDGEIDPEKLAKMSSYKRHDFFKTRFGEENAVNINTLFEKKLLLKNKIQGYKNWIRQAVGVNKQTKVDLISKIERMDNILNPKQEEQFLQDLAKSRLKIDVTQDEAKIISELSRKITELKSKTDPTKSDIPLGRAKLDLLDYVNSISGKKADLLTNIAGAPRTIMTSFDLSAPLNQGWGMLSRKQFYTSLGSMLKYAKSESAFRDLQADIITRPTYDIAVRAGLRLTDLGQRLDMREEQFMSTLLDKVPGVKHSQRAYTGFLNKLRMDVFDDLLKKAEGMGEDVKLGSQASKDIASVVNNFTGGARVGKVEVAVPFLNSLFFSPRKIASTLQMMNPVNYISPKISKTARLGATRNLLGSLAITASVIGLYQLFTGRKQETDPTSSDFGKIKVGDTRLDLSGGNANYATLLARLISGRIKSTSGVKQELGTGFGQKSVFDLIAQFTRYKLSPIASFLVDAVVGANAVGEKKTIPQSAIDRFKPMFLNSVVELLKSDTEGKFGFILTSLFGAGLSTYSNTTNWNDSTGKELNQFKSKVGQEKFDKANEEFNKKYDEWFAETSQTDKYKSLNDEQKQKLLNSAKEKIKQNVFKSYDFEYKEEKTPDNSKELLKKISSVIEKTNNFLAKEVSASEKKDRIVKVEIEGDNLVTTILKEDGKYYYKFESVETGMELKEVIGKMVADIGKKYNLPELEISEKIGWNPEKHKQDLIDERQKLIPEKPVSNTPKPTEQTTYKKIETVIPEEGRKNAQKDIPLIEQALKDAGIYSKKVLAYALATTQHETANSFTPVNEGFFNDQKYGYEPGFTGKSQARSKGYGGGENFFGRGFIQLTHKSNYQEFGKLIGVDLIKDPELANDPKNASKILALFFKKRGIDKLVNEDKFIEARQKINPDDKGEMISDTAMKYLEKLM